MSRRERRVVPWVGYLLILIPTVLHAADPTSELLRLVPADAGVTLAVSDLRGHLATISGSSLARSFENLPTVKAWFASGGGAQFNRARGEIEKALGVPLPKIRDDLFGDAVVLSLHLRPDATPNAARGLLMLKARDRALLARLVELVNHAQIAEGTLAEVVDAGTADRPYRVRRFKAGGREAEYYRLFDDGTLAWSNSETLLQGILDRKAGASGGLGDDPAVTKVRKGLPDRSMAILLVNPHFAARLIDASPRSDTPREDRAAELLTRYLKSVAGLGAAIEWRDGFVLHVHEVVDPKGVDRRVVRWASSKSNSDALARRIPRSAIAASATTIDADALADALLNFVPAEGQPRLDLIFLALQGILLGKDVRKEIIPHLGPALIGYVEAPPSGSERFPVVGVLELRDDQGNRGVVAAIDNALRTILCLHALDPSRQALQLRVESRQAGPLRVTTIGGADSPFSYGVGPDCLVVGTSADAVARFGTSEPETRLDPFRAKYFADAKVYAAIDLARLAEVARTHREALVKRFVAARGGSSESVARDLDQAVGLLELFGGAFVAIAVEPDLSAVHQSFGLIAR